MSFLSYVQPKDVVVEVVFHFLAGRLFPTNQLYLSNWQNFDPKKNTSVMVGWVGWFGGRV